MVLEEADGGIGHSVKSILIEKRGDFYGVAMEYYLGATKIIICDDACSNPNQQKTDKQILKQVAAKALPALRQNTEKIGRENKENLK